MIANDTPIVRPVCGPNTPRLGPLAVMASNLDDLEKIRAAAGPPAIWKSRPLFNSRLYHATDGAGGCAAGPVVAAAYAVMVLETLVAWGVRRVVYFGWCGALGCELEIGDVLVPEAAVVDEGTSPAYGAPAGTRVDLDRDLTEALASAVARGGLDIHRGRIWTTDAVFRETPSRVAHFIREHQAVAVEMEVSALCSAARFLGVQMTAVLAVSDSLAGGRWQPGFKKPPFVRTRQILGAQIGALIRDSFWRSAPSAG